MASSGHDVRDVIFGDLQSASVSISGTVFQDTKGKGVHTSCETGLAGVTVFLDTNNNGVLDTGEISTTTDSKGNYRFTNLDAGTYHVAEVLPTGFMQTTAKPAAIVASSGDNVRDVIFGEFQMMSISGTALHDSSGNGVCNTSGAGMPGVTIFLDTVNHGVLCEVQSTTTDANGNFSFTNLGPGTYDVREVQQIGFMQVTANPAAIRARSGDNVADVIFGNIQLVANSGTTNPNGNSGGNTCPAALHRTADVDATPNGDHDTASSSTTTNTNCDYAFAH